MKTLRLLLVDEDVTYVECLTNYLRTAPQGKFRVSSFTETALLDEFLKEEREFDLVLTSEQFRAKLASRVKGLLLLFTEGSPQDDDQRVLAKYQPGEQLVAALLKIYATVVEGKSVLQSKRLASQTQIIGVYSPLGGVGKTTIALGSAIQMAWAGQNVFYLNLENTPSTRLYLRGKPVKNWAHVLYFLQEKSENLTEELESAKCQDPDYKIHYFASADSMWDFNEDLREVLLFLLQKLKESEEYDKILLDFSVVLQQNNLELLQACEQIILVTEATPLSFLKLEYFFQELQLLLAPEAATLFKDKFSLVMNKVGPGKLLTEKIGAQKVVASLPWVENLLIPQAEIYRLDFNSAWGQALYQFLLKGRMLNGNFN